MKDPTRHRETRTASAAEARAAYDRRSFGQRLAWSGLGVLGLGVGLSGPIAQSATTTKTTTEPATAATYHEQAGLPTELLERSRFVYISPLRGDGSESTCHSELWYAWIGGSVIVTVASDRWKAGALARGLDRARIWVGDHGRWNTWYRGHNMEFMAAPHFDARARKLEDPKILDALLFRYEEKYPDEISRWRDTMRLGHIDGSRTLLGYTPIKH